MVGELHATLLLVGHVTVGTADASLSMNALKCHFIAWMLSLENRSLRQWVDVVIEADGIIVFLCSLAGHAFVLGEHQVVGLAWVVGVVGLDEIVLRMALCAHQRTHLLMRSLCKVLPCALPCLVDSRASRTQVHGACIMAVATANAIHNLIA